VRGNWLLDSMLVEIEKQQLYLCHIAINLISDEPTRENIIDAVKHMQCAVSALKKTIESYKEDEGCAKNEK